MSITTIEDGQDTVDLRTIKPGTIPTLDDLKAKAAKAEFVFYSVATCWWTLDPEHVGETKPESLAALLGEDSPLKRADGTVPGLPCDPRGGMLMQGDPLDFIAAAEQTVGHYGRHGLLAFRLAYHGAITHAGRPWCFRKWDAYNDVIDRVPEVKLAAGVAALERKSARIERLETDDPLMALGWKHGKLRRAAARLWLALPTLMNPELERASEILIRELELDPEGDVTAKMREILEKGGETP